MALMSSRLYRHFRKSLGARNSHGTPEFLLTPILAIPIPVFGVRVKQRKSLIWLRQNLSTVILMKRSRRELQITDIISKNNPVSVVPCPSPKTAGIGKLKTRASF